MVRHSILLVSHMRLCGDMWYIRSLRLIVCMFCLIRRQLWVCVFCEKPRVASVQTDLVHSVNLPTSAQNLRGHRHIYSKTPHITHTHMWQYVVWRCGIGRAPSKWRNPNGNTRARHSLAIFRRCRSPFVLTLNICFMHRQIPIDIAARA